MAHMDRISHLPEELLLRILSLLPSKNVVVTMVLSKRWKFLWMLVPRLEYEHKIYRDAEDKSLSRFVYSFLLLHEAPVLESLRLRFNHGWKSSAIDIGVWVRTAVKRFVRELDIEINSHAMKYPVILPWSLYSGGCRMLVTLKLNDTTLVDDSSLPASTFPSLKKLSLVNMTYPSEEFVNKLLSNCPVLEDLAVEQCPGDNLTSVLTVKIPSLKRLCFRCKQLLTDLNHDIDEEGKDCGIVIDAPLLESFSIFDNTGGLNVYVNSDGCCIMNNMPKIVYANLNISYRIRNVMGSITSVKRLYLRLSTAENAYYPVGSVFHRLVHLTLCICTTEWLKPLMCLLRDSPKLQVLKFEQCGGYENLHFCWNEPNSSVPECLSTSLETLEWVNYEGSEEEKQVVAFILRNASCLKKATISSRSTDPVKKLEMLRGLSFCQGVQVPVILHSTETTVILEWAGHLDEDTQLLLKRLLDVASYEIFVRQSEILASQLGLKPSNVVDASAMRVNGSQISESGKLFEAKGTLKRDLRLNLIQCNPSKDGLTEEVTDATELIDTQLSALRFVSDRVKNHEAEISVPSHDDTIHGQFVRIKSSQPLPVGALDFKKPGQSNMKPTLFDQEAQRWDEYSYETESEQTLSVTVSIEQSSEETSGSDSGSNLETQTESVTESESESDSPYTPQSDDDDSEDSAPHKMRDILSHDPAKQRKKAMGRFKRLKKKLGKVFHHHKKEQGRKASPWKQFQKKLHKNKEKLVERQWKSETKSLITRKKQHRGGQFHALVEGLMRHRRHSKKQKHKSQGHGKKSHWLRTLKKRQGGVKFPNRGRVMLGKKHYLSKNVQEQDDN